MRHVVVMGVSGTGKTTVGIGLARRLERGFLEGDDFHPPANREKMSGGVPLTNEDRKDWIAALTAAARKAGTAQVIACSALNPVVRGWLADGLGEAPLYLHLTGPKEVIAARLAARAGHFFDARLLDSQLAAMDPPAEAIAISVDQPVPAIIDEAVRRVTETGI